MLDEFISVNRIEIISRCRAKVATRSEPAPAPVEIDHGVPMFLDQLRDELRNGQSADTDITNTAARHGRDLLAQGYTVSQVVHDYGDVCQAVTELAVEQHAAISAEDFRTLNRCLDDAIAGAVTEYASDRHRSNEPDDTSGTSGTFDGSQRGRVVHDLVKTLQISKLAFEAIKSGNVGAGGSTGTVLSLGLDTANDLAERLLTEVLASGLTNDTDS
jgi:hypothetical protein